MEWPSGTDAILGRLGYRAALTGSRAIADDCLELVFGVAALAREDKFN